MFPRHKVSSRVAKSVPFRRLSLNKQSVTSQDNWGAEISQSGSRITGTDQWEKSKIWLNDTNILLCREGGREKEFCFDIPGRGFTAFGSWSLTYRRGIYFYISLLPSAIQFPAVYRMWQTPMMLLLSPGHWIFMATQIIVFSTCLHLTIIIHKWRQMKLQRERTHGLPLAGSRDSGRGLVRAEAPLPDLTLHDSPDVIINYWRCAVHHLDTHPLTLWLAHCEAWDTGNWPNAGAAHWPVRQSEISIHHHQPITRRQNCHPYPATSQLQFVSNR